MVTKLQERVVQLTDQPNAAHVFLDIIYPDRLVTGKLVHAAAVLAQLELVAQLITQRNVVHVTVDITCIRMENPVIGKAVLALTVVEQPERAV